MNSYNIIASGTSCDSCGLKISHPCPNRRSSCALAPGRHFQGASRGGGETEEKPDQTRNMEGCSWTDFSVNLGHMYVHMNRGNIGGSKFIRPSPQCGIIVEGQRITAMS